MAYLLRGLHFILEDIHLGRSEPAKGLCFAVVKTGPAGAERAIHKLKRVVAIEGTQKGQLERRFVRGLVKTWRADVLCLPVLSTS